MDGFMVSILCLKCVVGAGAVYMIAQRGLIDIGTPFNLAMVVYGVFILTDMAMPLIVKFLNENGLIDLSEY